MIHKTYQKRGICMNAWNDAKVKILIMTAMFAALVCVATSSIRIPTPMTGGYIHPGDAMVILSGVILGPFWGFLAGSIGSAISDIIGGYGIYVPATILIKGLVSMAAGLVYHRIGRSGKSRQLAVVLGGVADIVIVTLGYMIYESFLYGLATSIAGIPSSLVQSAIGTVLAVLIYPLLMAVPEVRRAANRTLS